MADSDDWNFGTGNFTIDCWVKFNALIDGYDQTFAAQYVDIYNNWRCVYYPASKNIDFRVKIGNIFHEVMCGWTPSTNTWYHIAFVRDGTASFANWKIFIDGVLQTNSYTTGSPDVSFPDFASALYIGQNGNNDAYINGYLDEFRISKGIARWTSNFTPPSAPYDVDTTPPTVSSTSPASNFTGIGVSSAISATFSEDMDSSTITTSTFTLSSGGVSGSSVGWVKRSAPNKTETEDDKDGFASLNPSLYVMVYIIN